VVQFGEDRLETVVAEVSAAVVRHQDEPVSPEHVRGVAPSTNS
jgi:hypothetical protein